MKKTVITGFCLLLTIPTPKQAWAIFTLGEDSLTISQLDVTFPNATQRYSPYGLLSADIGKVLSASNQDLTNGYLNVMNPTAQTDMWVVKNMPIDMASGYAGISTMFDLGNDPGQEVSDLSLIATLAEQPMFDPLHYDYYYPTTFQVERVENNAQGVGGPDEYSPTRVDPPGSRIDTSMINFNPLLTTRTIWQSGHPNIEQAVNQCMPAAVANSLQWLEDQFDIKVPHDHVAGERDDSLVGQLDKAMERPAGQPTASAKKYIKGKLDYIDDNALEDDLNIKHKERKGINWLSTSEKSPDGNAESKEDNSKRTLIDWILDELADDEDVEVRIGWDGGGGHMVELIGGGTVLGVPWLAWVHDAAQGKTGGLTFKEGGIGYSPIVDNKIVAYIGGKSLSGTIDFATSESVVDNSTEAPGDANSDGQVDVADLGILGANFNQSGMTLDDGDFNGDGIVDVSDLGILGANWTASRSTGDASLVPEPTTLSLFVMGVLLARRRSIHCMR